MSQNRRYVKMGKFVNPGFVRVIKMDENPSTTNWISGVYPAGKYAQRSSVPGEDTFGNPLWVANRVPIPGDWDYAGEN